MNGFLQTFYSLTVISIFRVKNLKILKSSNGKSYPQKVWYDFYRCWYLLSNNTTSNVILHDIDLHSQGETFSCFAFAIKKCIKTADDSGRFDLSRMAPRRRVALDQAFFQLQNRLSGILLVVCSRLADCSPH